MRALIQPGSTLAGDISVPGDKSIAHRWLMLAATARGTSEIRGLPPSLDVRSTASCLAAIARRGGASLEAWARGATAEAEGNGSTWNTRPGRTASMSLQVEGEGRSALEEPRTDLDCGNSGTTMRLLAGIVASASFEVRLIGDESLSGRPMERVAAPLREMGAEVSTEGGKPPLVVRGGPLRGIDHETVVPSAQVKSAVLLAGLAAEGETTVHESAATRDHTERALDSLGAPVRTGPGFVSVAAFQHDAFEGIVPGDPSSAAFLIGAAALTRCEVTIRSVGLNPTRVAFLDVLRRMGIGIELRTNGASMGEPVGDIHVSATSELKGTTVTEGELPLVVDEVPLLAALAAHAEGETWFIGAGELRFKETDRLSGVARGIRSLGGHGGDEGDDLVIAGGGLRGGSTSSNGDHRLAMALAVAALAAEGPVTIEGMEAAEVSFPGFIGSLVLLGARVEVR